MTVHVQEAVHRKCISFGKLISNERHAVTFSYNIISLFAFEQTHRYEACLVCEIFSFVGAKCCSFSFT